VLTLAVGYKAHRYGDRALLLAACVLMAATGLGFATVSSFWPLLLIAVVGTLNPSSGDVSVFLPLEHAVLSKRAPDSQRTSVFAAYSLAGAIAASIGALAATIPAWVTAQTHVSLVTAIQYMFVLYAAIAGLSGWLYRRLPETPSAERKVPAALGPSRKRIYTLAALFSLDAFGGGLVVQSLLALWLFERFQLSLATAGTIFFWTGLLSALSYIVAVRIANRIGLVNTMVFTHIPANVCLALIPFMPSLGT
jgi:MFS family permease